MNNMKYYNDSLAYDFDLFLPREARQHADPVVIRFEQEKNRSAKAKRQARQQASVSAFAVMSAFFVLAALCGNIMLRLQINEVNSAINDVKAKIGELDSEKTKLEVDLERRLSYSNIENEAALLGMKQMDKSQVTYIRVNQVNTAITENGKTIVAE